MPNDFHELSSSHSDVITAQEKRRLRKTLRATRRELTPRQQRLASRGLIRQLTTQPDYIRVEHVALYWANDGEIDVTPLMHRLHSDSKQVYLPVLHPLQPRLWFRPWYPGAKMKNNRFGIPEPVRGTKIPPWFLDWVLLPLVGFDEAGGRLGMGGGFYDRTFAHRDRWPREPARIGVAHECQKVERVPLEPWDIPLAKVATDRGIY
ncbi:5-formyltetrahydrofolate cyclo-ligase [Saccharospirillum salsuginis]|uniref:5-formyltetrahydrofolate cyclo-ligase n=1 Tax=Saccharospirillum salsuginis TaxID=418750 RepID=A0A918KTN7_9GAMM|nr:5-formyltetrahydrofolate cyclo-ligase [Saccharospirillum salsuginis]GGX75931.1 5-formyltetrahydrofolate cyclo-ligase [Saccharospirillum salsuginis]